MTLNIYLLAVNLALFILMGADKRAAKLQAWRVPEKTLFTVALIGGAIGGTLGMYAFRHKTKHWYFKFGFPLIAAVQIGLYVYFVFI